MALSPSVLAGLISSNLTSEGAKGANLQKFCAAVGAGIVQSIVGKAFTTTDVGLVIGAGAGTGVGVIGLSNSQMISVALSQMATKGRNAEKLMSAIMNATVTHLGSATLTTVNAPVFVGAGTVVVGSIAVVESQMALNIDTQLQGVGAKGKNRTHLANAIAAGVARQIIAAGTGTVTIVGSVIVPPPVAGAGVGTGTIS